MMGQSVVLWRRIAVSAMLVVALPMAAQAQSSITAEPRMLRAPLRADAPQVAALAQQAEKQGQVRLIVRIAQTPDVASSTVSDAGLATAHEKFRSRARALRAAYVEPINGMPLSVIEVDARQLREMVNAGLISDMVEDIPVPPTLQDSIPLIRANVAPASGATGAGQAIAILDTGVEAAHPFFGGRVVSEACYSSNSPSQGATTVCPGGVTTSTAAGSGAPCVGGSSCDHGTHVAGIAAGQAANRRGVAPQANIISIQVFSLFRDVPGGAQSCANAGRPSPCVLTFLSDQIRGLQRVLDLRNTFSIAAVNMSVGGGTPTVNCDSDSRKTLVDQLRAANIATVIASGNDGSSTGVSTPGCISTAITVGSTTKADAVSSFSNSASSVDLLAPGSSITSAVLSGGFASKSGTSMATPHVAGAFAALRSVRNDLTVDQINTALRNTGVSITDTRNNLTRPRIILAAAVQSVLPPVVPITPDEYTVEEGSRTVGLGNVLDNDGAGPGATVSVVIAWNALTKKHEEKAVPSGGFNFETILGGFAAIFPNGTLNYVAPIIKHPSGVDRVTDSFQYRVRSGNGNQSAFAAVSINITDTVPVAENDAYTFAAPRLSGNVMSNDKQSLDWISRVMQTPDSKDIRNIVWKVRLGGGEAEVVLSGTPYNSNGPATLTTANGGRVWINQDGRFEYIPNASFKGVETFQYQLTDGDGSPSGWATVTFNVP